MASSLATQDARSHFLIEVAFPGRKNQMKELGTQEMASVVIYLSHEKNSLSTFFFLKNRTSHLRNFQKYNLHLKKMSELFNTRRKQK